MSCDVGEATEGWRMSCDVGKATEGWRMSCDVGKATEGWRMSCDVGEAPHKHYFNIGEIGPIKVSKFGLWAMSASGTNPSTKLYIKFNWEHFPRFSVNQIGILRGSQFNNRNSLGNDKNEIYDYGS